VKPLDSFPAFYMSQMFITAFVRAVHLPLPRARPIQSSSTHSVSQRPIFILSTHRRLGLLEVSFPLVFLVSLFALHAPPISSSPRLDYSNYTWRRVQITKVLVMQFSQPFLHFNSIRSKYPPQHPVLKHPQSVFLPKCQRPSFSLIQNRKQYYSLVYIYCILQENSEHWHECK
jgi:hypothetical protein